MSGGQELLEALQRMGPRGAVIGLKVLKDKAKKIAARAKQIVPVDDVDGGDLRDSIREAKASKTKAGRISVGVVAGGARLARIASERKRKNPGAYAHIQHEDLTLHHPGGGQAKFIESSVIDVAPEVPDALRAEMNLG